MVGQRTCAGLWLALCRGSCCSGHIAHLRTLQPEIPRGCLVLALSLGCYSCAHIICSQESSLQTMPVAPHDGRKLLGLGGSRCLKRSKKCRKGMMKRWKVGKKIVKKCMEYKCKKWA